ncbi:Wzz/FepE/Etk N-terminal domain-containing protein [Legionella hackeliae]|uniref:Polysaccharide chain length determinant N-terminal domain-containing protein n=1 Tax=Legionella hackeliae TaxID=449 RepID=A0A0A8UT35_LEGHA|nr:Wzz/FepE/Etk N-terminal domain-containing protein [Legionella hackeliae]KTD08819.1 LPS O-antigen length regulator [Legionella hackeliae]CEK10247.1 protein of unknown function [Legionella hackeliae]STX46976.1 chain length determinant protein WzzB [Legionella hackeliae]
MKKQSIATYDPEIELIALFKLFWVKKWFIIGITIICTLVGVVLTHSIKPIYEAKGIFIPPITSDLAELALGKTETTAIKPLNITDAYNIFKGIILADSIKQSFLKRFQTNNNESLVSITATLESAGRFGVVVKATNRNDALRYAKEFSETLQNEARAKVAASINQELKSYQTYYQREIALAKQHAREEREDQIVRLKEALKIAKSLNAEKPAINTLSDADISNPSYTRGSKSLEEEINSLEKRSSDEPFSPRLRKLEFEYESLTTIKPNMKNILLARLDGDIVVSDNSISHKREILLILSVLIGFLIGCAFVLFRNYNLVLNSPRE